MKMPSDDSHAPPARSTATHHPSPAFIVPYVTPFFPSIQTLLMPLASHVRSRCSFLHKLFHIPLARFESTLRVAIESVSRCGILGRWSVAAAVAKSASLLHCTCSLERHVHHILTVHVYLCML